MDIKPKIINCLPLCSEEKCDMYCREVESGWGVAIKCFAWNKKDHEKFPFFPGPTLCKPYLEESMKKIRQTTD